jgi:lysophospholipase L1-like esterase
MQQILVYGDSLTWGILPDTRERLAFERRWPIVKEVLVVAPPPIRPPKGMVAVKFSGAPDRCAGLAKAYQEVTRELECHFFDSGTVAESSTVDGIHLDPDQHAILGHALARVVAPLLQAG